MISTKQINLSRLIFAALVLSMCAATSTVSAKDRHFHGPRISIGFGIGFGPFGYGYPLGYSRNYYPAYYYPYQSNYYPEVMVSTVVAPTPVYVRPDDAVSTRSLPTTQAEISTNDNDWYYCHNPDGFYPSIKTCPSGWQRVPAQAPADR
ncbi:MAG: hypothetical protein V4447_07645 [Pseudomonadota bacterium]